MTLFDYAFLTLLVVSLLAGFRRGLLGEAFALSGWVFILIVVRLGAPLLVPLLADHIAIPWVAWAAASMGLFLAARLILGMIRSMLRGSLEAVGLSSFDRLFGACFGALRAIFLTVLLVAVAGLTQAPQAAWWRDSASAAAFETAVIIGKSWLPPDLAARIKYR